MIPDYFILFFLGHSLVCGFGALLRCVQSTLLDQYTEVEAYINILFIIIVAPNPSGGCGDREKKAAWQRRG